MNARELPPPDDNPEIQTSEGPSQYYDFFDPLNHNWSALRSPLPKDGWQFGSAKVPGIDELLAASELSLPVYSEEQAFSMRAEQAAQEAQRRDTVTVNIRDRVADSFQHGVRTHEDLQQSYGEPFVTAAANYCLQVIDLVHQSNRALHINAQLQIAQRAQATQLERTGRRCGPMSLETILLDAILVARPKHGDLKLVADAAAQAFQCLLIN